MAIPPSFKSALRPSTVVCSVPSGMGMMRPAAMPCSMPMAAEAIPANSDMSDCVAVTPSHGLDGLDSGNTCTTSVRANTSDMWLVGPMISH